MRLHAALVATLALTLNACGGDVSALEGQEKINMAKVESKSTGEGAAAAAEKQKLVYVRVIDKEGKLSEPTLTAKVVKTDAEWKKQLPAESYEISRHAGTELAGSGALLNNHEKGIFFCIGCGLPLFSSEHKFESGTGWPSYYLPIASENVIERLDTSAGMDRTEILCDRCDGHLGHLFNDGPEPTGLRYCLNSASLKFVATGDLKKMSEEVGKQEVAEAVFAGGCFWCVEAVFEQIDGVYEAISGYSGGDAKTANYPAVCNGDTGHAEAVKIIYDPQKVSYEQLLKVHFKTHDPTTLNQQGPDTGTQYRSAIFYASDEQKKETESFIAKLASDKAFARPIVTSLEKLDGFYPAEPYHQNFVCRNPTQGYVQAIAMPKLEKMKVTFKDGLMKKD